MKQQITLTFLQYYYLLKSLLFKLLLLNPQAKSVIGKRCSEDIIFWLEFFVKLPKTCHCERSAAILHTSGLNNDQETNQNPGIAGKASERGDAPLCDSLGSSPFLKGLGKETLSQRIQNLKASFKPQTSYSSYYWLKYKKDYILEVKERIENNKPLLVVKSANMDETTCTALVLLWFWLYKENANFYTLGQTAKHLYYTKDSHSIFNLYKYVLNNLPHSLFYTDQPPPKNNKQNKLPYKLTVNRKKKFFVKLTNCQNGNIIYGFSGSKRNYFPQHKQVKAVWLNNFAFHKKQQEHYTALQNISNCLIVTSIPNGNGNLFYELSISKRIERYKLHWVLNPHYDEKWYSNVIANTELNNIHQFLDIGYEYKIKRRRLIKTSTPVKKAAKKVAVVQATTRTKSSTFYKTFTDTRKTLYKSYHRTSKSIYTPDTYELTKKSLVNKSLKAVNIPVVNDNSNDRVYQRWQKMNKLIRQNNKAQISSVQTALRLVLHHYPDLTNTLLSEPQIPKVNYRINNRYEKIHFKTLFPNVIEEKQENPGIAGKASEREKSRRSRQEESGIMPPPLSDSLGSSPFLKGLGGIGDEVAERGESPLNCHCEEQSDAAILHTSDTDNNQETNTTSNKGVRKATEGGVCDSLGSSPFLKGLGGIARKASERGKAPLCGKGDHPPETNTTSNKGVRKATEGGVSDSLGSNPFPKGLGLDSHCKRSAAIQDQHSPDLNNDHKTNNNDKEKSSNALRGLQRGFTPLHAVDRAAGGEDTLPPENKKLNKQEQFFNQYKKKKNYKVRSTRFNITIKPPKHKQNNKGIGAESTERGESPLCGKWHLPPPKHKQNNNNKKEEEPP